MEALDGRQFLGDRRTFREPSQRAVPQQARDLVEAAGGIGFTAGATGGLKPEASDSDDLKLLHRK